MVDDETIRDLLEHGRLPAGEQAPSSVVRVRDALRSPSTWDEPPPDTLNRVLAGIAAERADPPARAARHRRAGRRQFLVAAAIVVALAGGGLAGWFAHESSGPGGERVALAATSLAPGASAVATIRDTGSGLAISLDVTGLGPAAPGTFYEAWVKSPDGALVPIGTFHLRRGNDTVQLWAGVDTTRYPTLTVTIQIEGAGTQSSGKVVLRGSIPRR